MCLEQARGLLLGAGCGVSSRLDRRHAVTSGKSHGLFIPSGGARRHHPFEGTCESPVRIAPAGFVEDETTRPHEGGNDVRLHSASHRGRRRARAAALEVGGAAERLFRLRP